MTLTGPVVQWGSAALAVLAGVALVAGWARLGRPGALAVLARSGALVGVNGLVVLALLVSANDHYAFYSDWDDLFGVPPATTSAVVGAAAGTAAAVAGSEGAALRAGTTHPTSPEGSDVTGYDGRVQQLQVTGHGTTGSVLVVLPRGYRTTSAADTAYPVVVALHGYPGNPKQWLTAMDLEGVLDTATSAQHLTDPVVVIPQLQLPARRDTECLDGPTGQPQLETWLSTDVPRAVEASYRVRTSPQAWAAMGFSMGGWCAAELAMLHPQQYGAAIVLGGYFSYDPGSWKPFATDSDQAKAHDLVTLAGSSSAPAVSLFVASSKTDPESWPSTKAFLAATRAPLSVTSLVAATGGHRSAVWKAQLPQALAWLGSTVPGFATST